MELAAVDVSAWEVDRDETLGASEKYWLRDPTDDHPTKRLWLFKPVVVHGNGHRQQGDFSERMASQLASLIGVPSAEVRLAVREERQGTLSRNVRTGGEWEIFNGGLWLINDSSNDYRGRSSKTRDSFTHGYTLDSIQASLRNVAAPPDGEALQQLDGFDVFAGFLLLDAIISNRDRHEQNWSVLRHALGTEPTRLAPAYDNESALGFNLTDARRSRMLADPPMLAAYRERASAWRFDWEPGEVPNLIQLAAHALQRSSPEGRAYWKQGVESIRLDDLQSVVDTATGMSEVSRRFCLALMNANLEGVRYAIDV